MLVTGALAVVWSVLWPLVTPHSRLGPLLVNGETWSTRLLQSLGYCPLVTLVSTAIGVGVAFAISRTSMPFRDGFRLLTILPLSMPPFLGALAFKNLMGNFGLVTKGLDLSAGLAPAAIQSRRIWYSCESAVNRLPP